MYTLMPFVSDANGVALPRDATVYPRSPYHASRRRLFLFFSVAQSSAAGDANRAA